MLLLLSIFVVPVAFGADGATPVASFTYSPSEPVTGRVVTFDGSGSTCASTPCAYVWSNDGPDGPGGTNRPLGTGQVLTFTFHRAGTKYVRLMVTDALGRTSTTEQDVTMASFQQPPVAPANTVAPAITGTPQQGQTLTASNGTWTGTTPISYRYAWSDGATGATDTLPAADVGKSLTVEVTATNSAGQSSATSPSVGPVTAAPPPPTPINTALPVISGTPERGQTLTVSNGSWTGSPTSFTYLWSDGSTSSSDLLTAADVGQTLTATVTATNSSGSTSATSAGVGPVTAPPPRVAPANTVLPAISGTPQQGDTLTISQGTWTGTAPISYTYAWSDGTVGSSDTLSAADVGQTITATVTATNSAGSTPATGAAVGPVTAASSTNNCLPIPSACGYPDATNSGIAGCPALTSSGSINANTAGATYSDLDISGTVSVSAANVTFNCVRITDNNPSGNQGYVLNIEGSGTLVEHSEVNGQNGSQDACIQGSGVTLNYVSVHGCVDGMHLGWNVTITNSWFHDNGSDISGPHTDGLQWIGCSTCSNVPSNWNDLVQHNTIYPGRGDISPFTNSAVFIQAADGPVSGITIDNNLLDGGGYTVFTNSQNGYSAPSNVAFTNNRFGTYYHFGSCDFQSPSPTFTGNVLDATRLPLSC